MHDCNSNDAGVVVFVSDIDKSVRWYQVNVGLAEISELIIAERRLGAPAIVMTRNGFGLTLVFLPAQLYVLAIHR